jgi:glycosyltransferase involved in cell wall biosynthesis
VSAGVVSVVLPCFDAERLLPAALDSILGQTYRDLEVITLDDGSRDGTREILRAYEGRDRRVRVLVNETNLGLIRTLNRGIVEARGAFIARMDADDVAAPQRVERQMQLLERRPDVAVVGTGGDLIDEGGRILGPAVLRCREPMGARFLALFATPIAHASMLARTDVLKRYPYRLADECLHAEDYDLFARMLADGVGFCNLDEPLHQSRIRPGSVSFRHERVQTANFAKLARRHLERTLKVSLDRRSHRVLINRMDGDAGPGDLVRGLAFLDRIQDSFLARMVGGAEDRAEVMTIAHEQRADILIQALLKGTAFRRAAALVLLFRYASSLLSLPARRYIGAKFGFTGPSLLAWARR